MELHVSPALHYDADVLVLGAGRRPQRRRSPPAGRAPGSSLWSKGAAPEAWPPPGWWAPL